MQTLIDPFELLPHPPPAVTSGSVSAACSSRPVSLSLDSRTTLVDVDEAEIDWFDVLED